MELKQAICDRRNIRKYQDKEVPAELVTELLELPDGIFVTSLITVGYPAQSPGPRPRRPLEELLLKEI